MSEKLEQQSLSQFSEKAYLDYSMYVILDRALPHIGVMDLNRYKGELSMLCLS